MLKQPMTILGILVALLPFLGLPGSVKSPVYLILGLSVAYLSYKEYKNSKKTAGMRRTHRKPKSAVSLSIRNGSSQNESETVSGSFIKNEDTQKSV